MNTYHRNTRKHLTAQTCITHKEIQDYNGERCFSVAVAVNGFLVTTYQFLLRYLYNKRWNEIHSQT